MSCRGYSQFSGVVANKDNPLSTEVVSSAKSLRLFLDSTGFIWCLSAVMQVRRRPSSGQQLKSMHTERSRNMALKLSK